MPNKPTLEKLFTTGAGGWWEPGEYIQDFWGRIHVLNKARKITVWRRIRARMGFAEKDTMLARGFERGE